MDSNFFYTTSAGRGLLKMMNRCGGFRAVAWFLKTPVSKALIPGFIRRNRIDMAPFAGQKYGSFAQFFAREKQTGDCDMSPNLLISPCDGLLSMYPVTGDLSIPMKGSRYTLTDLIPDSGIARDYAGGLCMVFRLRAQDYHHFCCLDTADLTETHFIPGVLHSVQPIACESVPVYRLNRRWWSILETAHFGRVIQVEVGAMAVGGVHFQQQCGHLAKGCEMGHFELMGSTILLFLKPEIVSGLELKEDFHPAMNGLKEVPVAMGQGIGALKNVPGQGRGPCDLCM